MGLDVTLYRFEDFTEAQRLLNEYQQRSDELDWRDPRYRDWLAELAEELGVAWSDAADDLFPPGVERITIDSALYPEHPFKVGDFHSSYNDGGFNRVVRETLGKDGLYWIFEPHQERDDYILPDWPACLQRAQELRDEWITYVSTQGPFRVFHVGSNLSVDPLTLEARDELSALALFFKERKRAMSVNYKNKDGYFFPAEALTVRALIRGSMDISQGEDNMQGERVPMLYAIYEASDMDWYTQALEIVAEMCEWVLARDDPSQFVLSWGA